MIPIALSVFLWDRVFKRKKIAFHVDNLAVVTVLNSKSSKSPRVMNLLRFIVHPFPMPPALSVAYQN
jgi:hypothetical protein